ncbi:hypothetical protein [Amantichitinum ursilacus]|uniref:Uncharacterized protein n=1 Tax=Amantichitinum ursilacus TaxID=857265 RepID=A0A0N0GNZ9_9NEIS|nr:hypothetical protein [Amantichitinum ursilacus]KPC53315.1 hypothetical protein WG78_09505 [Amantichitinum ursilacus]
MSLALATKLLAGPLVIGLASLAGKRWGPNVAGLIGGLPLVAGCVTLALWMAFGQDYALATARSAPSGLWANAVYMLALGYSFGRLGWRGSLLCGWIVYLAVAITLAVTGLAQNQWVCIGALGALALAIKLLPQPSGMPHAVHMPHSELAVRMAVAFVLVVGLSSLSQTLGKSLTGVLSGGPVAATVIPAFTMASGDRNALLFQLRGFLTGLIGFGLCFLALPVLAASMGGWAALPAGLIAMGASMLLTTISRRRARA